MVERSRWAEPEPVVCHAPIRLLRVAWNGRAGLWETSIASASRDEMDHADRVIREAFPDMEPVFGGHSSYGGHRAPRDHTISFRLRDASGQYRSNVGWVGPEFLRSLTPDDIGPWCSEPTVIGASAEQRRCIRAAPSRVSDLLPSVDASRLPLSRRQAGMWNDLYLSPICRSIR